MFKNKKFLIILLLISVVLGAGIMFLETKGLWGSGGGVSGKCSYSPPGCHDIYCMQFIPDCVYSSANHGFPFAFNYVEEGGITGFYISPINLKMFILDFVIVTPISFIILALLIWFKKMIKYFFFKSKKSRIILFLIISVVLGLLIMFAEKPSVPVSREIRSSVQPSPESISWSGAFGFPFNFTHYDLIEKGGYYLSPTNWQMFVLDFIVITLIIFILLMLPMWLKLIVKKVKTKKA